MTPAPTKSPPPFSLRLTAQERRRLEAQAAGMPLGAYIRSRLLGDEAGHTRPHRRTRGAAPVRDHKALAEVLARLGASRLSGNLNQLARAANAGALPVSPETESALQAAGRDIAAIKALVMRALGIREG